MADLWHIVPGGQRLSTELSPAGNGFQDVWEVTYQVDSGPATGTVAQVKIPVELYNADAVKEAIDAAVYHIDQIAGL